MSSEPTREEILALPDLLQNLCDGNRTGTLVLIGRSKVFLYLREGALAAAYDEDPELFANCLVRTGAMKRTELQEFKEFFRPTPATLARLLIEQSKVGQEGLGRASEFAIRELLCDVLTWKAPRTEFHDGPPLPELVRVNLPLENVAVPTKPLLMEAVYQLDEWKRIREVLPSDDDVLQAVEGKTSEGAQADILALVDGSLRVADLVRQSPLGRFETCGALRDLLEAGAVRVLDRDELVVVADGLKTEALLDPATRDRLVAIYERAESLGLENSAVSLWLAQALEERGDVEKASQRYLHVGRELARRQERGSTRAFRRGMELRPDDGALQRELILKLLSQDRLEDAALQTEGYVGWLRERGDAARALRSMRGILERLEEFEEILFLSAELHADAGNKAEALHYFRRAAQARLEGELTDEFSEVEKILVLERILELDPRDQTARFRLGLLLADLDPQRAAAELEAFVDVAKGNQEGNSDPRLIEAVETLERLNPSRSLMGPRAHAYIDCGELVLAEELLKKVLEEDSLDLDLLGAYERLHAVSNSKASHELLARALLQAGYLPRGIAQLQALARAHLEGGDLEESRAVHRQVLEHDPYEWISRSALAELQLELEDFEGWRKSMRDLADLARIGGQLDVAIETLKFYLVEAEDDRAARLLLAQLLVERGGEGLKDDLEELAKADPSLGDLIPKL